MEEQNLTLEVHEEVQELVHEHNGKVHRDVAVRRISEQLDISKAEAYRQLVTEVGAEFDSRGWTYADAYGGMAAREEILDTTRGPGRELDEESFYGLAVLEDVNHPHVPMVEEYYEQELPNADVTDVETLCRALTDADFSPLLVGEAGTGKDTLVEYVCSMTNRPVVRTNFGSDVRYEDLVGHYTLDRNENIKWVDGTLTHAVRYGYVFIADEINAAPPESTMPLHQVTEEGDRAELLLREEGERIEPHPQFRFVATMNPPRGGYGGTKQLNDAFKSRFYTIEVDYLSPEKEAELLEDKMGTTSHSRDDLDTLCKMADRLRTQYKREGINTPVTTRELIKTCKLAEVMTLREAARIVIGGHAKQEDEEQIYDIVESHV